MTVTEVTPFAGNASNSQGPYNDNVCPAPRPIIPTAEDYFSSTPGVYDCSTASGTTRTRSDQRSTNSNSNSSGSTISGNPETLKTPECEADHGDNGAGAYERKKNGGEFLRENRGEILFYEGE